MGEREATAEQLQVKAWLSADGNVTNVELSLYEVLCWQGCSHSYSYGCGHSLLHYSPLHSCVGHDSLLLHNSLDYLYLLLPTISTLISSTLDFSCMVKALADCNIELKNTLYLLIWKK